MSGHYYLSSNITDIYQEINFCDNNNIFTHTKNGTKTERRFQLCAVLLLYAFGFAGLRVTGLKLPQVPRFMALSSRCFFFESFS